MTETFYDMLGVSEDATTDEIQSAYRERLKEVHPDVSDDEDAGKTTQELVEARDVLVDEDERARYDRLGHDSYVDGGQSSVADAAAEYVDSDDTDETDTSAAGGTGQQGPRDRTRRERQARQRVRQERVTETRTTTTSGGQTTTDATSNDSYGPNTATVEGEPTYSVRTEVDTSRNFGPILPKGNRLTLLGIFFALYPVLLFSALLPAFPLFVNLVVGGCALVLIGYLQSMPRVALLVFGGWSFISIAFMLLVGIKFVSLVGIAILGGTVLPFGFSLLTAWALRY